MCKDVSSEEELLEKCRAIEGLSLSQVANKLSLSIPEDPNQRKGFAGMMVEMALGANAGNKSEPDFPNLGVELKTLPINHLCKPAESTFITSIPLLTVYKQTWVTSQCYAKLKRVLWVPIEDDDNIPYAHRRIGQGILWSPSNGDEAILANDWEELTLLISTGYVSTITAEMGEYLQVRPKAADSSALCYALDEDGQKVKTLPLGFYLRSTFTRRILL
ncbi:MAG: DNA mismatch repair endonuclease MutH [Legionellales bacterium RIFCSPHIGHO2_12_FULL_35_11]|nr:MAG: DNA mismatch repair endonuclease MutH [Legionellales bacterium RIFCSPHIGHO2_12_FULL_35_11]